MIDKPTLEQVRDLVASMVERAEGGWIGEGEDLAKQLLDYIDGNAPKAPQEWAEGISKRAYLVVLDDPGETRGPFDSSRQARQLLSKLPEEGAEVSPYGSTYPRASYVVMTREEFKTYSRGRGE